MKTKREQKGTCPCPTADCREVLQVFRYVERSARPSMFKDKFYATCPTHGRVIDASSKASQEHVLTRGDIWGATTPKTDPPAAPAPAPAKPAPVPSVLPPAVPTPKPASLPAVIPAPQPARPPLRGWNLWEWWEALIS